MTLDEAWDRVFDYADFIAKPNSPAFRFDSDLPYPKMDLISAFLTIFEKENLEEFSA